MRSLVAPLILGILTITGFATAAETPPATLAGSIVLDETLVVGPGDTLTVEAGTSITGTGRIEVHGHLRLAGTSATMIQIGVPLRIHANASLDAAHARFHGVRGSALTVEGGQLQGSDLVFEANDVGLDVQGPAATAGLQRAAFRGHALAGARVADGGLDLQGATFEDGTLGVAAEGASRVQLHASAFDRHGRHLLLRTNPEGVANASSNRWGPATTAGIAFVGAGSLALANNTFATGTTGLLLDAADARASSARDVFVGAVPALDARRGAATLHAPHLLSTAAIVASPHAHVQVVEPRYETGNALAATVTPDGRALWPFALGAALVGIAGAIALPRLLRKPVVEAPPPVPEPAPHPDLRDLSPMELRVLRDVVANPGTAQSEIAARLHVSRQALHYHVKKLAAAGLLTKTPAGRQTRCEVPPAVAAALPAQPPPGTQTRSHEDTEVA